MEDFRRDMGQRIKQRRKELKLTQEEMAEQLGVSVKHFSETERGISGFSLENLVKLSELLQMSLDALVKGERTDDEATWSYLLEPLASLPAEKQKDLIALLQLAIKLSQ